MDARISYRKLAEKYNVSLGSLSKIAKNRDKTENEAAKDVLKSLEEFCVGTNSKNTELCFQMLANFQRESNELAQQKIRSRVQKPITEFFKRTNKD